MNRTITSGVLLLAFAMCLSGCSKSGGASSDATASPAAVDSTDLTTPAASPADAGASPASTDAAASPAATDAGASPASTDAAASPGAASPAAAATTGASFSDISGVNGEKEIKELAQLGVLDPASGTFGPGTPVKRREFIRWLVKANNAIYAGQATKLVKVADKTETSSFPDISVNDPDFPYIQGMQDAGYSVGFPDKTFKPDQALTREQMFAIKNVFDRGSVDPGLAKDINFARNTILFKWKDDPQISKTYVAAIATGDGGGVTSFAQVYGSSSLFHPQLAVTRAQAAVAVSTVGNHSFYGNAMRTAAQALAATPAP